MNYSFSRWKIAIILMASIMLLLTVVSGLFCIYWEPESHAPTTIVNISLSLMGSVIVYIIYVGCALDKWVRGVPQNAFLFGLFMLSVTMFCTIAGCYVNGKPEYLWANVITNFGYFSASIILPATLWFYISYHRAEHRICLAYRIIIVATMAGMALLILNLFTGIIYTFTEDGWYHRVNIYLSFIAPLFILFVSIIWGLINMETLIEKRTMILFIVLTIGFGAIQFLYDGYQLMYIGGLLGIILVYFNIYIKRGYQLSQKDIDINNQRHAVMVSQIRPHFLYNVLNTIMSMEDIQSMRNAIALFGKYLRGNLDTASTTKPIPFMKELENVETYVALEKIRFESKLDVVYELEDIDFQIPALSVQVLVENAVRYGISRREEGGVVTIRSYSDKTDFYVKVEDDGVGFDTNQQVSSEETHSGIENTRSRIYDMVFGDLIVSSEPGEGTVATIRIPRVKPISRLFKL